jgi:hypothetical protein
MADRQRQLMAAALQRKDRLLTIPPNFKGPAVAKWRRRSRADGRGDKAKPGAPVWRREAGSDHADKQIHLDARDHHRDDEAANVERDKHRHTANKLDQRNDRGSEPAPIGCTKATSGWPQPMRTAPKSMSGGPLRAGQRRHYRSDF